MSFGWGYVGTIVCFVALALITWVVSTNPSTEASVRIQTVRGPTGVSTGPYRYIRHPMYVGLILMFVGTPLVWGSVWALAVAGVLAVLMIARTALEDRTLFNELAGYQEYAAHTRYRLIPGFW